MAITVCIAKDDQGAFSVYQEQPEEATAEAPAQALAEGMSAPTSDASMSAGTAPANEESQEQANAQPAPDLKSALMIAAKLLSQQDANTQQSMFDQGMSKTAPTRGPKY